MNINDITKRCEGIKNSLTDYESNLISKQHSHIVKPYIGSSDIKLIIIGQDPTVKIESSRGKISTTLNLDGNNALSSFISKICNKLGIELSNVYATNVFKYFYTTPPSKTMEVLEGHLEPNLCLLKDEIAQYPGCPIITLGEPVLKLLTDRKEKVRIYWDYDNKEKCSNHDYKYVHSNKNKLGRNFFPFPHQPSCSKQFYKTNFDEYLQYLKSSSNF